MNSSTNSLNDNVLAGSLASLFSIIGDTLTMLVIIGCYRIPSMKSSFGILTINQSLAEIVPCTACLVVFFFGLILNIQPVFDYSYIVGGTTMTMLYIILFGYFMISFNRFCAVAFPFAYNAMFREKYIIIILTIGWLIPVTISGYMLGYRQCAYYFSLNGWYFAQVKNEKCGDLLITFISFQIVPTSIIVVCDVCTLVLLIILRNRIFKSKSAEVRRREINFARQVLVQGVVFLCRGFWYRGGRNLMPETMSENWKIFWTTSFSTSVFHVFDPAIIFICNTEFRKWLLRIKTQPSKTIQISSSYNSNGL